jgi:hypothetical protein
MAIQTINVGTTANDGTGDDLRAAFQKVNANFFQTVIVADISALRTLPQNDNYNLVIVKSDANGNVGFYWADETITSSDDDGNSIIYATTAGIGFERKGL